MMNVHVYNMRKKEDLRTDSVYTDDHVSSSNSRIDFVFLSVHGNSQETKSMEFLRAFNHTIVTN